MIRSLPESEGPAIGLETSGKIDIEQESHWIDVFNKFVEEYKDINVLIVLEGKVNIDIDAAYEDLIWTFKHLRNIKNLR